MLASYACTSGHGQTYGHANGRSKRCGSCKRTGTCCDTANDKICHNELCDLTAAWLQDICHDVAFEPPCNHSVVNLHLQVWLFAVMMLGLISMQEVSGVDVKVHFLILGFFIPTHLVIVVPRLHPCFEDMNLRKSESMETVYELLNLLHLHLWCSQPLVSRKGGHYFLQSPS